MVEHSHAFLIYSITEEGTQKQYDPKESDNEDYAGGNDLFTSSYN